MYIPKPVELNDVELPGSLNDLIEVIAENVHDVWASKKIDEGWKYGPVKDVSKKETPQLVPYRELPESEKDYDRQTALSTLKLAKKMGYIIEIDFSK